MKNTIKILFALVTGVSMFFHQYYYATLERESYSLWFIFKDTFQAFFIAILVYEGMKTILKVDGKRL